MSIRMRHTKGHTGKRRSHHGLKSPRLTRDTETDSYHLRHRVDMKTGMYRGKKVFQTSQTADVKSESVNETESKTDSNKDKKDK